MKSISTTLFVLLCSFTIFSQTYYFKKSDTHSGLSQNIVKDICQDKLGRLWVSTFDGLSIYDGEEFILCSNKDGLDVPNISNLYEVNDSIMLGASDKGLYVFCKTFARNDTVIKKYIGKKYFVCNVIDKILKDWNNNYWFCTDSGITKWSLNKDGKLVVNNFGEKEGFPGLHVYGAVDYKNKILWFGSSAGLIKSDGERFFVEPNVPHEPIYSILVDGDSLFLGTGSDILVYKSGKVTDFGKHFKIEKTPGGHQLIVSNIMKDSWDNYWFSSAKGLLKFDGKNCSTINHTNSNFEKDFCIPIKEDNEKNIWVGTISGLYKHPDDSFNFLTGSDNISFLRAIETDSNGVVWVAAGSGIYTINGNKLIAFKYNSLIQPLGIITITFSNKNELLVGTKKGIYKFNNSLGSGKRLFEVYGKKELSPDYYYKMVSDKKGNIWVQNKDGNIFKISNDKMTPMNNTEKFKLYNFPKDRVYTLYDDSKNNIWMGYYGGGLYRIGRNNIIKFSSKDGLLDEYISGVYEDNNGIIWVSTKDHGIFKYSSGKFYQISIESGLKANRIKTIVADKFGNLWLGIEKGIMKYNGKTSKTYEDAEGVNSVEMSYSAVSKDGTIYFGTSDGIYFHKPEPGLREVLPKVHIKKFQFINGKNAVKRKVYPFADSILFTSASSKDSMHSTQNEFKYSYNQNSFSFQFVSTSLKNEEKNLYTYLLEGFDKSWSQLTKRNYVNYVNLPAGEYTFKVKTKNNDGQMSYPAELSFIITPPFWETWWFRILALIFVVSIVAIITTIINRYRLAQALKIEKMRTKIATDLHDDIGTSLSSIAIFSQLAKRKIPGSTGQVDGYLERIEKTSRNLIDAMSDIVWSINPNNDSLEDAVLKMEDYAVKLLEAKGIEVQVVTPREWENINLPLETRRNLLLIFKEIVTNTAKHSDAEKVKIEFNLTEEEHRNKKIIIQVEDNGVGFDVNKTYSGNGLKNLRSRAKSINGEISITSDKKNGSVYLFSLLIKN